MDILGIDEAGRGSVLGPMVIAGVIIPEKMEKVLERMGVKDSFIKKTKKDVWIWNCCHFSIRNW